MVVSEKHKYIFGSTPKAGTHTMYHLLETFFDGTRLPYSNTFHGVINNKGIPEKYKDYYKFTIVANPFRRALASWKPLVTQPMYIKRSWPQRIGGSEFIDFTRYLRRIKDSNFETAKKPLILPQCRLGHMHVEWDKIMHLETIQEDFNSLPFVDRHIDVPQHCSYNKFEGKDDWKKKYNQECIDNVLYAWGEDFDRLGYSKEL